MLLFLKIHKGDHKGDHPKSYFTLKSQKFLIFSKNFKFLKSKFILGWSPLWSPLLIFKKKHYLSFHWKKNHSKILRNGNFRRIWITNSSYPLLGLPHYWENNVKKSCFVRFSTFGPKIRHRMLQNAILRLETERTHPKWS